MEEKLELTMYIIEKWMLVRDVDKQSGQASVKFIVVLERRIMSELLGTYLPTFLLVGITFSTTFFKAEYFEAALTVGVFHIKNTYGFNILGVALSPKSAVFFNIVQKGGGDQPHVQKIWSKFCMILKAA